MKNIAFITCFNKTIFFEAIALKLKNYNIFWITPSLKWKEWLKSHGVQDENILLLEYCFSEKFLNTKLISDLESKTHENIKNIYFMDRIISKWKWEKAENYIHYLITKLNEFILNKDIFAITGEPTAMHEIISAIVCDYNDRHFFNLATMRLPSNKFLVFKGYRQLAFYEVNPKSQCVDYQEINEIREKLYKNDLKPFYMNSSKIPKVDAEFLKLSIKKVYEAIFRSGHDASIKSFKYHLLYEKKYLKPFNFRLTQNIFDEPNLEEKFVLYTLHKQPEASIDILGSKYSNQYELIKSIARELPSDICLYVKEHVSSLGERSIFELRKIKKIPGTKLINPFYSTIDLLNKSELVVTVSGTIAFEAGVLGKKVALFSDMFFDKLSSVKNLSNPYNIHSLISSNDKSDEIEDGKFISYLLLNSFEGVISDPISTPGCMNEENINNVAYGLSIVLKTLSTQCNY